MATTAKMNSVLRLSEENNWLSSIGSAKDWNMTLSFLAFCTIFLRFKLDLWSVAMRFVKLWWKSRNGGILISKGFLNIELALIPAKVWESKNCCNKIRLTAWRTDTVVEELFAWQLFKCEGTNKVSVYTARLQGIDMIQSEHPF